jgi:hypothetical protein
MKHPDSGEVFKREEWGFQVLSLSCVVQDFKFPPKLLGYLKDHRWGASTVLT